MLKPVILSLLIFLGVTPLWGNVEDRYAPQIELISPSQGDSAGFNPTIQFNVWSVDNAIASSNTYLYVDTQSTVTYNVENIYFTSDPTTINAGSYAFSFNDIALTITSGIHDLTLVVSDVGGLSATALVSLYFWESFAIHNIVNAPNPFGSNGTYLTYQLTGAADDVTIRLFTTSGKYLGSLNGTGSEGYNQIFWDGRDQFSVPLANDVYLYTVSAISTGGDKALGRGKLMIVR